MPLGDGSCLELPGGPAHYIAHALRLLRRPHRVVTGEIVTVEVIPGPGGDQHYLIPELPRLVLPYPLSDAAIILSPIMNEIGGDSVPDVEGLLVVDLQGFVRLPGVPTSRLADDVDLCPLLSRAHVIKAAPDELKALDSRSRGAIEGRTLLLTRGSSGLTMRTPDDEIDIEVSPVRAAHTIGAGDTLLAAFVAARVDGAGNEQAIRSAVQFTQSMLEGRAGDAPNCPG